MSWKDESQKGVRGKNTLIAITSLDTKFRKWQLNIMDITKKVKEKEWFQ